MYICTGEQSGFPYKEQIDKLGNAIIYMAENIQPLYKTKVLKLVYLLEEWAIREYGIPFFNFDFKVWKLGPVVTDLYVDLCAKPSLLSTYIHAEGDGDNNTRITPAKEFCDDEFSDLEIALMDRVIEAFRYKSAKDLVDITHRKHLPWYLTAKKNGVLAAFEDNKINTTDISVDMSLLLEEDPLKKEFYLSNLQFQSEIRNIKSSD